MAEINEDNASLWADWVKKYNKTVELFNTNYNGLLAQRGYIDSKHPELRAEYDQLVSAAQSHQKKLDALNRIKNSVVTWYQDFKRFFGLGAIQIIPVAIGLGAAGGTLALIGSWIKDAYKFAQRLNELKRLEASGLSPQQASVVLERTLGKANVPFLGIDLKWIILGGIALLTLPALLEGMKRRG